LGWRDDVAALLQTADIFVCPSRHEPLGNVVLEAWAQNVPVVATDSYGPGTLVDHMESGVLVPVDDAVMLSKAIRLVIEDDDLRDRIARQGRAAYEAEFTETSVVQQYMDFFQKVLS
jgi:glycosyltransferase involved in cell wall biosynthesis